MILVIDNYDSFTYNLVQYLGELSQDTIEVYRNDAIDLGQITSLNPTHIILSPGPCTPKEAGISNDIVKSLAGSFPILGVCLGCQTIADNYGGNIIKAPTLMHGKTSQIFHNYTETIFRNIPSPFTATRYHSLIVEAKSIENTDIEPVAWTDDHIIMALKHKEYPTMIGVQFHPESILTEHGHTLLQNFLNLNNQ